MEWNVATFITFIGLSVSIPLGSISLALASLSGATKVLTKNYQKKLSKVKKLVDIVTSASAVFETRVSKALKNAKIDDGKFSMLQTFHLETLNELSGVN